MDLEIEIDLSRFEGLFRTESGVTFRDKRGKPTKQEFNDALNYIKENDIYVDDEIKYWYKCKSRFQGGEKEDSYCICGHDIQYIYYIQCKNLIVQVGSCCIKKVNTDLYKSLVKEPCILCCKPMDLRFSICKEGFCSDQCKRIYRCKDWTFKGKNYPDGITYEKISQIDKSYTQWIITNYKTKYPEIKQYLQFQLDKSQTGFCKGSS